MSIRLLEVVFNHNSLNASNDAINLRRNATQFVTIPEWRHGSVNPEDSVAAYAIARTQGQTITIRARFERSDLLPATVEIRAINPTLASFEQWLPSLLSGLWPWPEYYRWWFDFYRQQLSTTLAISVLGEAEARPVTFGIDGRSDLEFFVLRDHHIASFGVGVYYMPWLWQYRHLPSNSWQNFALSIHKIYTILDLPTSPWVQQPHHAANTQLPWTRVLDYACRWAAGATHSDQAATLITAAVNNLGHGILAYDCSILDGDGLGLSHYTFTDLFSRSSGFFCTQFLERLRGGDGNGSLVNCTDCGTIVSTFANILGCNLSASRMGNVLTAFPLNPILAIGSVTWERACADIGSFGMHEVAWSGDCGSDDDVYDACLHLNAGADPTRAPFKALLPTKMQFGRPGSGQYVDKLVPPAGRSLCGPLPFSRIRRFVV